MSNFPSYQTPHGCFLSLSACNFRLLFSMALTISASVLLAGFAAQRFLHLTPCSMCTYQSYIHIAIAIIAAIGLLLRFNQLILLLLFSLIISSATAAFHVLIQRGIVSDICTYNTPIANVNELGQARKCSDPGPKIMSFSMAELNFLLSISQTIFIATSLLRRRHKGERI